MIFRRILFTLIGLTAFSFAQAQILDDSTKLVYGPNTTQYFTYQSVKFNQPKSYVIDTSVLNFHRWTNVNRFEHLVQDLGNVGTASRFMYYEVPTVIGATSGYSVYDTYFRNPTDIRYYDTKSPFSEVTAIVGGIGRAVADVKYARNITPYWNFGFDYYKLTADKQLGTARRGDRNVDSNQYDLHTNFATKDNKYKVMAHFSRLYHKVYESGGIRPQDGDQVPGDLWDYRDEETNLANGDAQSGFWRAQSRQWKNNYHLYHQYALTKNLQVYHEAERTNEVNYYYDNPLAINPNGLTNSDFNGAPLIRSDSTLDKNKFRFLMNEAGFKGDLGPIFYQFYAKRRIAAYDPKYLEEADNRVENYAGFNLRLDINNDNWLGAGAELQNNGNHLFKIDLQNKLVSARYRRARYDPGFMQQRYLGNHREWYNNFEPIASDQLYGQIHLKTNFLEFIPALSLTNINRQVYFGANRQPTQAGGSAQLLVPQMKLNFTFFKNFHLDNHVLYTKITGDAADAFRIPETVITSNLYFLGDLFDKKLNLQAGVEGHHRSRYYGYGYDPVTHQFHLQNRFQNPDQYWADAYANFRISRVIVFLKFVHINMGLEGEGYFPTAFYAGQKRTFDIGLRWLFFD